MPYSPNPPPPSNDIADILEWARQEFDAIAASQQEQLTVELRPSTIEPERPTAGLLAYADGVTWNPGSGEGTYEYREDGLWHKL